MKRCYERKLRIGREKEVRAFILINSRIDFNRFEKPYSISIFIVKNLKMRENRKKHYQRESTMLLKSEMKSASG